MKVQQDSVDSYLEDVVIRAGEKAADQEARQEIKEHAANIDRIADEMDKRSVYLPRQHLPLLYDNRCTVIIQISSSADAARPRHWSPCWIYTGIVHKVKEVNILSTFSSA